MADLVPIRVRLYRRPRDLDRKRKAGQAGYPDFNKLPVVAASGLPWTIYLKVYGSDWIGRDKVANLGTGAAFGQVIALVPEPFADEALAEFPHLVELLDETEAGAFYDTRCAVHLPDVVEDEAVMARIDRVTRLATSGVRAPLTVEERAEFAAALDPDDPTPGAKRNPMKTWARRKARDGWTVAKARAIPQGESKTTLLPAPPDWEAGTD